ncbi:hypothetical protein ElyMa_005999000 [Elysia marginata]|uniref:Uncharacterized protein n=1 Tax=Elysia marginata TaxID=1093978 RepID=A0AAV4GIZ1_9GAST|nr:hypothetical protein ElyMa_005999000 [Elysia marginata]
MSAARPGHTYRTFKVTSPPHGSLIGRGLAWGSQCLAHFGVAVSPVPLPVISSSRLLLASYAEWSSSSGQELVWISMRWTTAEKKVGRKGRDDMEEKVGGCTKHKTVVCVFCGLSPSRGGLARMLEPGEEEFGEKIHALPGEVCVHFLSRVEWVEEEGGWETGGERKTRQRNNARGREIN